MKFIAEHAFYGALNSELKIVNPSDVVRGSAHHVEHGDEIDVYLYFKSMAKKSEKLSPIFIHTHPIGCTYFSGTDDATLYAYATMLSPKPILMQVVTESVILTKKAWFEPLDAWKRRKKFDPKTVRQYVVDDWSDSQLFTNEIYLMNKKLYNEIRALSYKKTESSSIAQELRNFINRFRKRST